AAPALAAAILFRDRAPQKLVEPVAGAAARAVAPLRALQSGHPGDYTAWLVVGLALLAWCALALLVP
ncbi:MAG TPA: hypothetical protein VHB21_12140, partial [Minicystis sp.]|nr:hypothetical protein [Minicystis sp.]